ncbi:MAG: hypothetical protein HOP18_04680 [Deltaproteobacteria bacterium]|nr:hypothetical protein [Deltaproteobacteria bacterium]
MRNHPSFLSTTPRMEIKARVCPAGHVYLYVGHTCLFLQQDEFQDMAQIVQAAENYLREDANESLLE